MKKFLASLAVAAATVLSAPTLAHADTLAYPPAPIPGSVSAGTVATGVAVAFSGGGFQPGSDVTITVVGPADVPSQVLPAGSEGAFRAQLSFAVAGVYTLTAEGIGPNGQPHVVTASVKVLRDAASRVVDEGDDEGILPRTGSDGVAAQLWAGAGLLAAGAGLVAVTVSRRKADVSA